MTVKWYLHPSWTDTSLYIAHLIGEIDTRNVGLTYTVRHKISWGTYLKEKFSFGNDYILREGAAL